MKNNLLKSVATVATASALLFSTVTSFAATATTVTTYKDNGKVGVTSTITGATAGKMITYLASYKVDGSVEKAGDIAYIGQQTVPDSGNVTFSYDITKEGMTPDSVIAKVKYGSDDAVTATALNKDETSEVKYGALTITKNNCSIQIGGVKVTETNDVKIGNGETVDVTIEPDDKYAINEIYINGEKYSGAASTVQVEYDAVGTDLVVICGAVTNDTTSAVKVKDCNETVEGKTMKGIVCHGSVAKETDNSNVKFGVVAKEGNNYFNMEGIVDGFYEAEVTGDGFYAVQLETTENITLVPAYKSGDEVMECK